MGGICGHTKDIEKAIEKHKNVIIESEIVNENNTFYVRLKSDISIKEVIELLDTLPNYEEIVYMDEYPNVVLGLFYD